MREKPFEIEHFQILTNPVQAGLGPTWTAGVARDGKKIKKTRLQWRGRVYTCRIPGSKMEILVKRPSIGFSQRGRGME